MNYSTPQYHQHSHGNIGKRGNGILVCRIIINYSDRLSLSAISGYRHKLHSKSYLTMYMVINPLVTLYFSGTASNMAAKVDAQHSFIFHSRLYLFLSLWTHNSFLLGATAGIAADPEIITSTLDRGLAKWHPNLSAIIYGPRLDGHSNDSIIDAMLTRKYRSSWMLLLVNRLAPSSEVGGKQRQ